MATRKTPLATGEIYHIYNRGVDKRIIFGDKYDSDRFLECMIAFNSRKPVGSLRKVRYAKNSGRAADNEVLVEIMAYCLNPNHFHLLIRQRIDGGISEFIKRVCGGYTWYFNQKYDRSGTLFQGKFKESHIDDNDYLLHVSAYINLNDQVHSYSGRTAEVVRSSWREYLGRDKSKKQIICLKDEILGQFDSENEYERFALRALEEMRARKQALKDWYHE